MSTQNIIKLNVGGTLFQTTKSTLTRFNGFFKTMLETDVPLATDQSDAIFIDRPAKHFDLILSYMRGDTIDRPSSETVRQEVLKEAQFYLLDGLVKLCQFPKIRYLKSLDDTLDAFAYTEKKAVLVVHYQLDEIEGASRMVRIVDKYREMLDVYFYLSENKKLHSSNWLFDLHVKSMCFYTCGSVARLDEIIGNYIK